MASLAAPLGGAPAGDLLAPPGASAAAARAPASLEELLPALVRRVAWSGNAQRGTVHLELGAGALAGATLLVQSDGGRVSVQLRAPPGVDAAAWKERIVGRLTRRGLRLDAVEIG